MGGGTLSGRYPTLDMHSRDAIIVTALAHIDLDADAAELSQAIREGSPNLIQRTGGHVDAYISRRATNALRVARH